MSLQCHFFDVMKKEKKETYTYSTTPSVHRMADKRARALGSTLSEEIDRMLKRFNAPVKKRRTQIANIENLHNNIIGQDPQ